MSADVPRSPWLAVFAPPHALRRWPTPRQPDESPMAKAARYAADRRRLAALDDRLLMDVGLDRHAVAAGLPFQDPLTRHRLAHQHWSRKP
jgi:uncharacterized protein YjiS (DUF1127 family)